MTHGVTSELSEVSAHMEGLVWLQLRRGWQEKRGTGPRQRKALKGTKSSSASQILQQGHRRKPPQASWAPRLHKGHGAPVPWQLSLSFCTNLDRSSLLPLYVVIEQTTPFPIQIWRSQWHSTSRLRQSLEGTDRMWLGLLLLCCYSSEKRTEMNLEGKSPCWH